LCHILFLSSFLSFCLSGFFSLFDVVCKSGVLRVVQSVAGLWFAQDRELIGKPPPHVLAEALWGALCGVAVVVQGWQ
jgi:hypothetical protein